MHCLQMTKWGAVTMMNTAPQKSTKGPSCFDNHLPSQNMLRNGQNVNVNIKDRRCKNDFSPFSPVSKSSSCLTSALWIWWRTYSLPRVCHWASTQQPQNTMVFILKHGDESSIALSSAVIQNAHASFLTLQCPVSEHYISSKANPTNSKSAPYCLPHLNSLNSPVLPLGQLTGSNFDPTLMPYRHAARCSGSGMCTNAIPGTLVNLDDWLENHLTASVPTQPLPTAKYCFFCQKTVLRYAFQLQNTLA